MPVVLITGANRGIGLELAKRYAARGDRVIACCRHPESAIGLKAVQGNVSVHALKVDDPASVAALASSLGGQAIDLLINNAGVLGPDYGDQTATRMDFDGWAQAFAINTMGPVRVMQALLPNLRAAQQARVMTVTSQMGALSLDMALGHAYSATKAAINKFMRLAALDLAKEGIAVGLIHPGWVKTDMGGPEADITVEESGAGIVATTEKLNLSTTGSFWKWNGETHGW